MKLACGVVLLTLLVAIDSAEERVMRAKRGFRTGAADRFSHGFGKRTQEDFETIQKKLGFRQGASDRFSHGFGKRTDEYEYPETMLSVQEVSDLIASNPTMRDALVQRHMDINGDGYISRNELLGFAEEK